LHVTPVHGSSITQSPPTQCVPEAHTTFVQASVGGGGGGGGGGGCVLQVANEYEQRCSAEHVTWGHACDPSLHVRHGRIGAEQSAAVLHNPPSNSACFACAGSCSSVGGSAVSIAHPTKQSAALHAKTYFVCIRNSSVEADAPAHVHSPTRKLAERRDARHSLI
jgi:hypothetical protein